MTGPEGPHRVSRTRTHCPQSVPAPPLIHEGAACRPAPGTAHRHECFLPRPTPGLPRSPSLSRKGASPSRQPGTPDRGSHEAAQPPGGAEQGMRPSVWRTRGRWESRRHFLNRGHGSSGWDGVEWLPRASNSQAPTQGAIPVAGPHRHPGCRPTGSRSPGHAGSGPTAPASRQGPPGSASPRAAMCPLWPAQPELALRWDGRPAGRLARTQSLQEELGVPGPSWSGEPHFTWK